MPWTDEEVIIALREEADAMPNEFMRQRRLREARWLEKSGSLSASMFRTASSRLVRQCAICGRPALYRWYVEGRCRAHKMVHERADIVRRGQFARKSAVVEASTKQRNQILMAAERHHRACGRRKSSPGDHE